jgi:hypothetical protein
LSEVGQLCGADEGEVCRVEDEDGPLACCFQVSEGDLAEVALTRLVGFHFKVGNDSADGGEEGGCIHVKFGGQGLSAVERLEADF